VHLVIFTTCGSAKEAEKIADLLLRKKLAACANIIPRIESKFWWQGRIDCAKEALIIIKAPARNLRRIEKEIKRLHSYELPEMIALPVAGGSKEYLEWIDKSAGKGR
jgi:periplasmic divalent cation tolerance protein